MKWSARYDPYPDLVKRSLSIHREIDVMAKGGEMSVGQARSAHAGVRRACESFVMYATIGKDRKKLGPWWVDKMEQQARTAIALTRLDEKDDLRAQLAGAVSEVTRLKGLLTLWGNFASPEVRAVVPGPNGKSLEELTHEAFGGAPDA